MTAPKTLVSWGFAANPEATYGVINAAGVGNGVLLTKVPTVDPSKWLNMGDRGVTPAGGRRQDAPNSGRWGEMKLEAEAIGSKNTVAYAAGVKPQLDPMILAAGYSGTGSFTGGQENWLYQPAAQPTALTSVTMEATVAGQLYRLFGTYNDLSIAGNGPIVPLWTFDAIGMQDAIVDAAIPSFTSYPVESDMPQKGDAVGLKIGSFVGGNNAGNMTGVVKSWAFKANRAHKNVRVAISSALGSSGIAGYTPAYRDPELEIVMERCALATVSPWQTSNTINPYMLAESKLPVLVQLDFGVTQYRRWHFQSGASVSAGLPNPLAQAVLKEVKDTAEGPTATWTMKFRFFESTYGLNDSHSFLFN